MRRTDNNMGTITHRYANGHEWLIYRTEAWGCLIAVEMMTGRMHEICSTEHTQFLQEEYAS